MVQETPILRRHTAFMIATMLGVLAVGGGLLGGRLAERGRTALSVGGSVVVVGLAAALALG